MTPSTRSVFVQLDSPDQDHARCLSIHGNSARKTCGCRTCVGSGRFESANTRNKPPATMVHSRSLPATE